jgi:L-ribulose-5-phosphate 3-epimerase
MKIAFSLIIKDDGSPERMLEMIRAGGFQGVEPTFGVEGTLPTTADPRRSAEKLKTLADKSGLRIPSMRGGPLFWGTFASSDPAQRKRAIQLAEQALDAVKIMGGDMLLIVPGQWEADLTYTAVWENALETAKGIADVAGRAGIKVGLENVENRFLYSPREWMQFLDAVGSDRVRMYFDAGNVVYLRQGFPDQWIRELGKKYITRIHFKDATQDGKLTYLLEGQVNWPAVRSAIRDIGYDDWIGIELTLPTHHVDAMLAGTYLAAETILSQG